MRYRVFGSGAYLLTVPVQRQSPDAADYATMRGMVTSANDTDRRRQALQRWVEAALGAPPVKMEAASSDASFRRYFRVTSVAGESVIAMDAPPTHEDCRPYVKVAGLLADAGLNAPRILAADIERGFLLISDLGRQTYLDVINDANADALFAAAIEALVRWQRATVPGELPPYDAALLRRELDLFPDWYLKRHMGVELAGDRLHAWGNCCQTLVASAEAQPQVYVHRDYMPRNLMISDPEPGIVDFQDAVIGAVTYDAVSLFKDAFLSWSDERVAVWRRQYWESARRAGVPVQEEYADFERAFDWMGLQRHLKVLGIFARLDYRDGKPRYLAETPRFVKYVRDVAARYEEFRPLLDLFDSLPA
ncbi:MAG TPA: phosphotransferase [Gammaproteobacteria bacterium]|nr:phosphotransferase [Gammaproteobacteria bacterium]